MRHGAFRPAGCDGELAHRGGALVEQAEDGVSKRVSERAYLVGAGERKPFLERVVGRRRSHRGNRLNVPERSN